MGQVVVMDCVVYKKLTSTGKKVGMKVPTYTDAEEMAALWLNDPDVACVEISTGIDLRIITREDLQSKKD